MNPSSKLLPTELAAIVHHIELNRSGWWDKTMQRLVFASIWLSEDNQTLSEIQNIFKTEFGLSLNQTKFNSVARELEHQGFLIKLSDGHFRIPNEKRHIFEKEITDAQKSAEDAQEYFRELVEKFCDDLPFDDAWSKFESIFLAPLIHETGANAYNLIAGKKIAVNERLLRKLQDEFDPKIENQIFNLVSNFLNPSNQAVKSYVSRMLHAEFCVQASGLSDSVITKLNSSIGKKIKFRVFVDTNFLFSILDLHDNPSNLAATDLKDLIKSLNSDLKIDLYVMPRTVDEAKRSLSAAKSQLAEIPVGINFTQAAAHAEFSGLAGRYFIARSENSGIMSADDWFDPYIHSFVAIAEGHGVKLFNENLNDYSTRQDVVDDIISASENETIRGVASKSYRAIEHDMILWHFVKDNRPDYVESPVDAKDWILTLDFRLIKFDATKHEHESTTIPICVHPTSLIQILQFWVPRTPEFEEAILGSMCLPFLFQKFDAEAERTSLRILRGIGKFEGNQQIPEESISRVILDQGLRIRLASTESSNEREGQELIRDALVEKMAALTHEEKQRVENLNTTITDKDTSILLLTGKSTTDDKKIKALQTQNDATDEKLTIAEKTLGKHIKKIQAKSAIIKYTFLFIGILLLSGINAWLLPSFLHIITNSIGIIPTQIFILISTFIFSHLVFEKCVKHNDPTHELSLFQQVRRFRVWLWSVVLVGIGIGLISDIITSNI